MAVEAAGSRVDPAMLSGGIWIALLTTAFGLLVAIPAMAAFYWLEGRLDSFAATLKDACARALERRGLGSSGAATEGGRVNLADEDYGV
jgi:biopolymer transport protein ExbB